MVAATKWKNWLAFDLCWQVNCLASSSKVFVEVLDTDFDYICFWICVIVVYTIVISKHHVG